MTKKINTTGRSLVFGFSLLGSVIMLLSFVVVVAIFYFQQRQLFQGQVRLYGETVLENLVQTIELTDSKHGVVQAYVVAVGTSPGVRQLLIADSGGHVMAHTDPQQKGRRAFEETEVARRRHRVVEVISSPESEESFLRIMQPVDLDFAVHGNHGLAMIDLDLPRSGFFDSGMKWGRVIVAFLCLLAGSIALLYFYLDRRVFRVVAGMRKGAGRFADGNFEARIPVEELDELGHLAMSFNRMAEILGNTMVSKDFFDNILRSMADVLFVLDPRLRITMTNPAVTEMLGYSEQEVLGRPLADFVADSHLMMAEDNADALMRTIKAGASIELLFVDREGRAVPVLFSGARIDGESPGGAVVCVARDISERKLIEEEMRQINHGLLAANEELNTTQAQLVQSAKMASLGEMAAGIAHELNQPLHIVGMSAQLSSMALEAGQVDVVAEKLVKIEEQVRRAASIINHLRTFARATDDDARVEYDLVKIIDDAFTMFREQFRLAGIEVESTVAEGLPAIICNPIRIEQVLTNILSNARDALRDAPVKRIAVRSWREGDQVVLEIEDSGHGIPEAAQEKIFDPFYTTKEVGKGTGLGLAISYGIIEEHGGVLEVESTPGQRTCFRIRLLSVGQKENVA